MPEEAVVNFAMKAASTEEWPGEWPQTLQEFESFVDLFLDRLVRIAYHRLGSMEEAEDTVQDVLVKAYADRVKLRKVRRVGAYLYRMTANACNDRRRRQKVLSIEELGPEDLPDRHSEVEEQIAAAEFVQRIEQLLRRLPKRQAEVIRLKILDQFSFAEVAEITGCSIPTAKSRLYDGLRRLRRIIPETRGESI